MAAHASEARLQFLKEAASQLAFSAQAVSSDLSLTYAKSVIDAQDDPQRAKKAWDALQRDTCGACGNAMLPGWSSLVGLKSQPGTGQKRHPKKTAPSKTQIVSACLRCDRKSVQSLPARKPKHINPRSKRNPIEVSRPVVPASDQTGMDSDKVTKSANATSKQRKKSRKGGLQAMLEKSKSQSSGQGGLGLDLMDFMQ